MVINVCDIILSHLDFVNEKSTNQFKVIVWRTAQKKKTTTQKVEAATQKKANYCPKERDYYPKEVITTQKVLAYFKALSL